MSGVPLRESSLPQNINCPVLITPRLVLRLPHEEDIEALAELADNPQIAAQIAHLPSPFRRTDAEDFIRRAIEGKAGYYVYAITRADKGDFIGCCGIGSATGADKYLPEQRPPLAVLYPPLPPHNAAPRGQENAGQGGNQAAAEIFFWLGRPYWGKGFGAETAAALTDAAFRATDLAMLYAEAQTDNGAACRILQKCGFSLRNMEGRIEKGAAAAKSVSHYGLSREAWLEYRRKRA